MTITHDDMRQFLARHKVAHNATLYNTLKSQTDILMRCGFKLNELFVAPRTPQNAPEVLPNACKRRKEIQ